MKTGARIREHVTGTAMTKPTAIMKKHEGAVTMLLEAHIQKCVSLSLMAFFTYIFA
jgi:glycerol dehydrogenase-like iron-containing ADH family enzyme